MPVAMALGAIFVLCSLGVSFIADHQILNDERKRIAHATKLLKSTCAETLGAANRRCHAALAPALLSEQRAERELSAQRRSALWALIMGTAALVGMCLSAIGVGLVWITFRETRRSSDAATQSYEALVKFESGVIDLDFREKPIVTNLEGQRSVSVQLKIRNLGRSPALFESLTFEGKEAAIYNKAVASGTQTNIQETFTAVVPEDGAVRAVVGYSTAIKHSLKRMIVISVPNEISDDAQVTIHPGYVIEPTDSDFENPFS